MTHLMTSCDGLGARQMVYCGRHINTLYVSEKALLEGAFGGVLAALRRWIW